MTRNQIAYWALEEIKRSNQIREVETGRSNLAHESLTGFHNVTSRTKVEQDFTLGQQANRLTEQRDFVNKEIGYGKLALQASELAVSEQQVGINARHADIAARNAESNAKSADASLMTAGANITNSLANASQADTAAERQLTYDYEATNRIVYNIAENRVHAQDANTRQKVQEAGLFKIKSDNFWRGIEVGPSYLKLLIP